jgi:hypothetical protein
VREVGERRARKKGSQERGKIWERGTWRERGGGSQGRGELRERVEVKTAALTQSNMTKNSSIF